MRLRLASTLLLLAVMLSAPATYAAMPATDAQVDRLLTLTRARETVAAMIPQIRASQRQMVAQMTAGQSFTAEQRARFDAIMDKVAARSEQMLAWENLEPIYRDMYKQSFESEDMEAMIGFYGSAAGQKVLDKMPQLMQSLMASMQKMIVPMMQGMQEDVEAELRKPASTAPAPSAPASPATGN